MGICFSKKKKKKQTLISDPHPKEALVLEVKAVKKPKNKNPIQIRTQTQTQKVEEEVKPPNEAQPTVEKKKPAVFVSTEKPIDNDEEPLPATVRTSSCSKEEVDAILIQCGRLSRSSSSKAAASAAAAADRKYSGSKRSYDFDNDKSLMDEEVENHIVSRPSPSPSPRGKRTPNNRERNGGGGGASRRVSRSPGRRSEGVGALNVGERNAKQQQPAKMVSVPAREKGVSSTGSAKKGGGGAASTTNRRNASSGRSRSPANNGRVLSENAGVHQVQPQLLSRSSSRKAENSPSRRNPMTEIDENSLRGNNTTNKKKTTDVVTIKKNKNNNNNINSFVRERLKSCRQKEEKEKEKEPEIVEEGKEMKEEMFNHRALTRTRSSRKSSRDFDHIMGLNYPDTNATTAYTSSSSSFLVEDIQNYHQVSLPACVSKACSILEAVADLNSSSSDQPNSRFARRGLNQKDPFVETEVKGKDDLMEPCLEKYTSEMEPQESAGSNSIVGQPWHSSWEMNSVDSTDRYWTTSQSNHGEEPDEESSAIRDFEARGKSLRGGGSSSSNNSSLPNATGSSGNKRRDFDNRQVVRGGGGNAKGGGRRAFSNPVAS